MEAGAAGAAQVIQPVQRPQAANTTEGVARREDGGASSPFSPQTNVSIKNSISDMAGVLAKISANQDEAVEAMPKALQQVIQNVMESAFSLDASLAKGLGSTVESQRFSMEQLTTLSRMLSQLSTLGEKGVSLEGMSDDVQALLQNLKTFVTMTEGGEALEPALLNKLAFELLDTKAASDLPAALQQLLGQMLVPASSAAQTNTSTDHVGLLKQLIQYFLPQPAETVSMGTMAEQTVQTGQNSTENMAQAMQQASEGGMKPSASASEPSAAAQAEEQSLRAAQQNENVSAGGAVQTKPGTAQQLSAMPQTDVSQAQFEEAQANTPNTAKGQALNTLPDVSAGRTLGETLLETSESSAAGQEGVGLQEETAGQQTGMAQTRAAGTAQSSGLQQEAATGLKQSFQPAQSIPLQNTQQTMDTMKSLASLLLRDAELTPQDSALLQNFVNKAQTALSEEDAKQLQLLLRLSQSNVPAAVQQAATRQNLTDLPRLWAFMQLCDMTAVKDMKPRQLKAASRDLADFVSAMKQSMGGENTSSVDSQGTVNRSMNFMLPLYLGESGQQSYPAYIHVYDEEKKTEGQDAPQKETWLRLCVLTENIGAVELTCRIYEKQKLNVRVAFSNRSAVQSFQEYVPEFKASFADSPLELTDLKVGVAGTKL